VQKLRRSAKHQEAAAILKAAPSDVAALVDGDAWWDERKMIARKLLDAGEPQLAYEVAAGHSATGAESLIEAEFHAGWIALRFLDRPAPALAHFARAAESASTPISQARAWYWQARAAELGEDPDDAQRLYSLAADHSSVYYGQLARARLGYADQPVRRAAEAAEDDQRIEAVRAVELFESIGEKDLAFRLTVDLAREITDDRQIAALGHVLTRAKDARATLIVGKLAAQRGVALDDIAFPTFGIPKFEKLERSAEMPVVYAIARQESAFQAQAASHAGAKGLMQMLPSTARRTAQRAGVPFDEKRLLQDPAFNAMLGAAHLSELMDEHGQSLILTFAAYNAGGHRVKQWIAAYGDPRKPDVDPIDWIERIPFTETRNYVQRVVENLGMYRARFGADDAPRLVVKDLRARDVRLARAP
jgi:soluble lytic murein transglycosylase